MKQEELHNPKLNFSANVYVVCKFVLETVCGRSNLARVLGLVGQVFSYLEAYRNDRRISRLLAIESREFLFYIQEHRSSFLGLSRQIAGQYSIFVTIAVFHVTIRLFPLIIVIIRSKVRAAESLVKLTQNKCAYVW
jgi:hypothetical protein